MTLLADRLGQVRARLDRAGGRDVTLVGVAKTFGADAVREAYEAGLADIGESYAQELAAKASQLDDLTDLRWHFVGALQRNKVRRLAGRVHLWQSIDRPSLVDELARRDPGASLLIQVNSTGESQKSGCALGETAELVARAAESGLEVDGLMTIGAQDDSAATDRAFTTTRRLADDLGLRHCSMGMSADLEIAVAAGSTMVRVGRDLFGARS